MAAAKSVDKVKPAPIPEGKLLVIAPAQRVCPKALSRELITDSTPVLVPDDHYYRRLVAEGSLLLVSQEG